MPILPPAVHPTSKPNTPDASKVKPGTISEVDPKSISSIDVAPAKTSKYYPSLFLYERALTELDINIPADIPIIKFLTLILFPYN